MIPARVAMSRIEVPAKPEMGRGGGILGVYKDGAAWSAHVVDLEGRVRPEWVEPLLASVPDGRAVEPGQWGLGGSAAEALRALGDRLEGEGVLVAAALFRTR